MKIKDFTPLSKKYFYIICDVTGVVHDGVKPIADAVCALNNLALLGTNIIFLSNSTVASSIVEQKLESCGIKNTSNVVSSGSFFLRDLNQAQIIKDLEQKVYVIGNTLDERLRQQQYLFERLNITGDISEAKYIYIAHFFEHFEDKTIFDDKLKHAVSLGLKAICANNDDIAMHGDNIRFTQGFLAQKYQAMGGEVIFYGKPTLAIYKHIERQFGIEKDKTLAIGDYLYTDIAGANRFGVDSLLILDGNHKKDKKFIAENIKSLEPLLRPTYLADKLLFLQ